MTTRARLAYVVMAAASVAALGRAEEQPAANPPSASAPVSGVTTSPGEWARRVAAVRSVPGFVALWDFVTRDPRTQHFAAHQAPGDNHDFHLDAVNYVRDYWNEGRPASYDDFPLLGRGPFGQAVRLLPESDRTFRPLLIVPRARLHGSGLDVKGPGRSVSMVVWLVRETGNHAIGGIWHEGTNLREPHHTPASRVEPGKRQYALFAGLAANTGASAAHVSENGGSSFGDKFARNLSVTPTLIRSVSADASAGDVDRAWTMVGFTFDNDRNIVTSYLDDQAQEYWIEAPAVHPFFKWPAAAWQQAQWRRQPGVQDGEDAAFPEAQFYEPPEHTPRRTELVSQRDGERVEVQTFEYTRVRVTSRREPGDAAWRVASRELVALRANPFWFAHDLYAPAQPEDGGPFTIGRVIHTSRNVGFTGYIGGVAVFGRALSPAEMGALAALATSPIPLSATDLQERE